MLCSQSTKYQTKVTKVMSSTNGQSVEICRIERSLRERETERRKRDLTLRPSMKIPWTKIPTKLVTNNLNYIQMLLL